MVNDFDKLIFVVLPSASTKPIMPQMNSVLCLFWMEFGKIINRKVIFVLVNVVQIFEWAEV